MSTLISSPASLIFSRDPAFYRIESEKMSGVSAPYDADEPNLSCYIRVEQQNSAGEWMQILAMAPPYSRLSKKVDFDLSAAISSLRPPLPGAGLFGSAMVAPVADTKAYAAFRVKHADQYGSPLVTDALSTSDPIVAIRGASSYWQGLPQTTGFVMLHSYKVSHRGYSTVQKTIAPDQPELVYFWIPSSMAITFSCAIQYTDGTTGTASQSSTFTPPAGGAVMHQYIGMDQLGINAAAAGRTVSSYILTISAGEQSETIHYVVDASPNVYAIDIMYENGCGGMEVVRMSGRHKLNHSVSKTSIERARWYGSNMQDGLSQSIDFAGAPQLELSTGYHTAEYVQHLAALIYSDIWLIDKDRNDYYRYEIGSGSVTASDDQRNPDVFTISATRAMRSPTASTFHE